MISELTVKAEELWEAGVEQRRRFDSRFRGNDKINLKPVPHNFTVKDLPLSQRPRERLTALGAGALSEMELLACLLGRGIAGESVLMTAQRLLNRFGSIEGIAQASVPELAQVRGIGQAKAAQLIAACELSRRAEKNSVPASGPIETTQAALKIARGHLLHRKKEYFIALLLDARHRLLQVVEISVGSLDASIVHPRETFQQAIAAGAAAMIVAHNHPSGDPTPSPEDLDLTRRLIQAGRLLGIPVLDHLIIGREGDLSLQQRGFLEG